MLITYSKTCNSLYLLLLLIFPAYLQAANSAASSLMSQAMLSMMDAMGNLAQDYNRNRGWSSNSYSQPFNSWQGMNYAPWSMYALPGSIPGQQQIQGLVTQAPTTLMSAPQTLQGTAATLVPQIQIPAQSPLDGIWEGQRGELVLVMYGHFRIYANAETYRDGRYEVRNNQIIMNDPETGAVRAFDFALSEGRLVLRSKEGKLLLFRQLPIPIPPYSLFSGQSSMLPNQQTGTDQE